MDQEPAPQNRPVQWDLERANADRQPLVPGLMGVTLADPSGPPLVGTTPDKRSAPVRQGGRKSDFWPVLLPAALGYQPQREERVTIVSVCMRLFSNAWRAVRGGGR